MKSKLIITIITLACSQFVFASDRPKPDHCPSVEAIRAVGISKIAQSVVGDWVGVAYDQQYDTKESWSLVIPTDAKDKEEATANINATLDSLQLFEGLTQDPIFGVWGCEYHSNTSVAYLVTPSNSDPNSMLKIAHR